MPRDGSGDFTLADGPLVNGEIADADEMNTILDDIADSMSDSINVAGTKSFGANQSMGGNKLTDLAAPTNANDAARKTYVDTQISTLSQPLDADLTAIAATSYTSGNMLLQKTAADTWSVTLTPSVSSVTASQGAANTTPSGTFVNTTDNASVRVARFEGDRATPATSDAAYNSHFLSNAAGTQVEFARQTWIGANITNGAESGQLRWGTVQGGTLADRMFLQNTFFAPVSNDLLTLGTATLSWGDLFLASGGVIGWNNGDVLITHSSNALEVTGGGFAAPLLRSSEVSGTLTSASRNRVLQVTGNVTLDDGVFAADDWQVFVADGTDRTFTRASGLTMYVNGVDSASATLPARQSGGAVWASGTVVNLTGAFR